jgi:redox-sensitive bicupin YhaK (pirin superfamily)
MTAGSGLIHAEVSSAEFMKQGGDLEILQLWVNLPSNFKMVEPAYTGLQKEDIPSIELDSGKVSIQAVAGNWGGTIGAFSPLSDIQLALVQLKTGGIYRKAIAADRNIFFYVVKGSVTVNNCQARIHELVEFNNDETDINVEALEDSIILLGHALPFNESIVAYGPFVMNTEEEIQQAYEDYQQGLFGSWR